MEKRGNMPELKKLLEIERERLHLISQKTGLGSKEALMQSIIVDRVLNQLHAR